MSLHCHARGVDFLLPKEETLFKRHEFDVARKGVLVVNVIVAMFHFYLQLKTSDPKGEVASEILPMKRLLTGMVFLAIALVCAACASGRWGLSWLRRRILPHSQLFWGAAASYLLLSQVFWRVMVERQLSFQSVDKCSHENQIGLCPNALWSVTSVCSVLTSLYVVNLYFGLWFHHALPLSLAFVSVYLCTLIPVGPFKDYVWADGFLDWQVITGALQIVFHCALSLRICYQIEEKKVSAFGYARRIQLYKETKRKVMGTMLPDRLHSGVLLDTKSSLLVEEFSCVTILFCQFDKLDLTRIGSADTFLQLVAKCIGEFDQIVHACSLTKVEHIGSDYVVTCPNINLGLRRSDSVNSAKTREAFATDVVHVALELVKKGNSISVDNHQLHFRAGVHSGPLIGGIAGKMRRFYRLFGDTVNTAARICSNAEVGAVQISDSTKELMQQSSEHFSLTAKVECLKGKEHGMKLYTISPSQSSAMPHSGLSQLFHEDVDIQVVTMAPSMVDDTTSDNWSADDSMADRSYYSIELTIASLAVKAETENWDLILLKVHKTIGKLWHKFNEPSLELQFSEDMKELALSEFKDSLLLKGVLLTTFYASLFSVVNWSSSLELFTTGGLCFLMGAFHIILWYCVQRYGSLVRSQCMDTSLIVTSIGLVCIFAVLHSGFKLLALLILVVVQFGQDVSPEKYVASTLSTLVASTLIMLVQGHYSRSEIFGPVIISLTAFLMLFLCNLWESRDSRATWQIGHLLKKENDRMESVLNDLMPSEEAKDFMKARYTQMILPKDESITWISNPVVCCLDGRSHAFVLCSDLVNFTPLCEKLSPRYVVTLLHYLWCTMDSVILKQQQSFFDNQYSESASHRSIIPAQFKPFKMDTIGDAYVTVSRVQHSSIESNTKAIYDIITIASLMMNGVDEFSKNDAPELLGIDPGMINMRMGLAFGEVTSGVVGYLQPRYHIYGETIAKATRLESQSRPGHLRMCEKAMEYMPSELKYAPEFCLISSLINPSSTQLDMSLFFPQ